MAFPLAVVQGALMGVAVNAFTNVINDRSPFDNALQSLLLGGVSGGIFGGAEGAVPFGESTLAGNMSNLFGGAGSAAGVGKGVAGATLDATPNVIPAQNLSISSGNASADLVNKFGGALNPAIGETFNNFTVPNQETYLNNENFLSDPEAALQSRDYALLQQKQGLIPQPPVQVEQTVGTQAVANLDYPLTNRESSVGFREAGGRLAGTDPVRNYFTNPPTPANNFNAPAENYYNAPANTSSNPFKLNAMSPSGGTPASTASPKFTEDPFGYLTHKDNRGTAMLGGLGIAGAMGAFKPNTLKNQSPQTAPFYETTYNAPKFVTDPTTGRVTYVAGSQGYGPGTRVTRNVATGGGIRALSGGGDGETAPFVSMPSRGQKPANQKSTRLPEDAPAFKDYEGDDEFSKERGDQKRIDDALASMIKRLEEAGIAGTKNMAEGGLSNLPAAYQQPQYQMSDFANSPLFQPTGGNAPMQPGISEYIANLNQRSYAPPAPAAAPVVANTTSPTIYDPATQTYSTNPSYVVPAGVGDGSTNDSYDLQQGSGGDKAGGPIASKRYAMGGLAALPEYAAGGKLLSGDGDGMSDSIPAVIKGARPQRAALADGEFVIPADVVSHLGNGSTKAGGKRLYEMMANIRKARTGNSKQGKQINPMKFIPA